MTQLEKEIVFVRNAVYTEPEDQSAWLYQRYIFDLLLSNHTSVEISNHTNVEISNHTNVEKKLCFIQVEMNYIDDLVELEPESKCI